MGNIPQTDRLTSGTERVKAISDVVNKWLQPNNQKLKRAIDKTVEEGFFSFPDIQHQIRSLKEEITEEAMIRWIEKSEVKPGFLAHRKVLSLHAGNLPLAGIQDVIAIAITGANYCGKVSKKDPYLIDSLLVELRDHNLLKDPLWSTDLNMLKGVRAPFVLFSGAGQSIAALNDKITHLSLASSDARYLQRTAHFSIALLVTQNAGDMEALAEGVLRYGGKGCRSIGLVVAPFSADEIKCELTDYLEAYWVKNPPHEKPPESLRQRFAYNKAVGHSQVWLDDLLIEETLQEPDMPYLIHWVKGSAKKMVEIARRYDTNLQSIYLPDGVKPPKTLEHRCEPIWRAQRPPIDWEPDGVNPLKWFAEEEIALKKAQMSSNQN